MTACPSIAIVDPVGAKAGMNWYGIQLLNAFSNIGWQTYFLSNSNDAHDSVTVINVFDNAQERGLKSLKKILSGLIKARKVLLQKKVQFVILHIFRSDWLELLFSLVFYNSGFKVCLIIHDIESLDTQKNSLARKWILSRFHHYKVVHNVFSEQELKKIVSEKEAANLYVIAHGDFTGMIEQFRPDENEIRIHPFDNTKVNLLFFGQIKKVKGLDLLLKAMKSLDDRFKLTVAGKERDESIKDYSGLIDELKSKGSIEILNRHISDSERDFLLRNCDAVILPYRHIYQSGVLLMAMSYGKSVIASDLPAFKEIIVDGVNGILFKSGEIESLANAIRNLNKSEIHTMGNTAKAYVSDHFNWNKIAGLYVGMFSKQNETGH